MIRKWICLALWAASPIQAQVGSTALYTEFETKPSPGVVEALHEEVDTLMAPYGLQFVWRSLPETTNTSWAELAVVKFSGRCEVLPFAHNGRVERLGWTHISNKVVLPFAEVDCDGILTFLLPELSLRPPETRDALYGRAVGRVVAHELLHIFAQSAKHSDHGVDHSTLTAQQLLADGSQFDDHNSGRRMIRDAASPEHRPRDVSAAAGRVSYTREGCPACHGPEGKGTPHGPALRLAGRGLNEVILKGKLAKNQEKMLKRARDMRVPPPSLDQAEISDLVRFLMDL